MRWAPRPQRTPWTFVSRHPELSELGRRVQGCLRLRGGAAWRERRAGAGRVGPSVGAPSWEVAERKGGRQWSPCGCVCV